MLRAESIAQEALQGLHGLQGDGSQALLKDEPRVSLFDIGAGWVSKFIETRRPKGGISTP